jgi:diguanylate cyclase (GGDEF)-like protein
MIFSQLFDMVNLGIIILDRDLKVQRWNRWLEMHTRITAAEIIGSSLPDHFPNLNKNWFIKSCKSVFNVGNFTFLSQKLHNYFIPITPVHHFDPEFKYMQQNCTLGPIYNDKKEIEYIYMIIQDATEVAAYEAKILDINTKDKLTEIQNRRYFESKLKHEIDRHRRYKRPLSLIIIDIDAFKKTNDTYGTQAGDSVLIQLAALFTNRLRVVDTIARYAGEEFAIILPETTIHGAEVVAGQLRDLVRNTRFTFGNETMNITISLGVISANGDEVTVETLLKKIRGILDDAKTKGPDAVIIPAA